MRPAVVGALIGIVLAFVAITSCSINHRSEQYACTRSDDCAGGRVCDNGFCIIPGSIDAPRGDAQKPPGDAASCPAGCSSCNTVLKTCTIDCQKTNCTNTVTCPTGYKCEILCNVDNSCRNGVNCQNSTSCNVECTGNSACRNVVCGPGPCDVGCSGPSSCRGVSCANSCACDVVCSGNQSCQDAIVCSSLACRSTTGSGCTSVPAFCHSCN